MAFGTQPDDAAVVPISSVYSKENNTFPALVAEPGAYQDTNSNQSSAAVMSFLRPLIVQKAHNITGSAGKTLTCAFTNANIAGNSIIVCMGMGEVDNGSTITLAVTDSNSNTYISTPKATQSTTLEAAIFYATNIASGSNTITITIAGASSSNTAIAVEIYEVWGLVNLAGTLDQTSTGSNAGSTSPATGAIVPQAPNELCFAAIASGGGTITAGTNFTLDSGTLSPTGGNLVSFGAESQVLPSINSITPSATLGTSNAWAMCAATFHSVVMPVQGLVIALLQAVQGTALLADQSNTELRTSIYGKHTTAGDTAFNLDSSGNPSVNQNGTWTVQPGNTPNTSAWLVQNVVASSNGSIPYHNLSAASTNSTNVKGSAAQMYGYAISNTNASARYVKFYDKSTAPTIGTDTPKHTIEVPGSSIVIRAFPEGLHFSNGFGWGTTTGVADSDTGAVGSNDLVVDFSLNS